MNNSRRIREEYGMGLFFNIPTKMDCIYVSGKLHVDETRPFISSIVGKMDPIPL